MALMHDGEGQCRGISDMSPDDVFAEFVEPYLTERNYFPRLVHDIPRFRERLLALRSLSDGNVRYLNVTGE